MNVCMEEADNTNVLDRSFLYKGQKDLYVCESEFKGLVLSRGKCMRGGGYSRIQQDWKNVVVGDGSNLFINGGG